MNQSSIEEHIYIEFISKEEEYEEGEEKTRGFCLRLEDKYKHKGNSFW